MNCSNCGNILEPGAKYCTVCGAIVTPAQEMNGQGSQGPVNMVWSPRGSEAGTGQMPNMNQQMPNMNQQVPNMNQQVPNMNQQVPNMNQQVPNMNQQVPNMNRQTPNMNQQMPNMNQQNNKLKFAIIGVVAALVLMIGVVGLGIHLVLSVANRGGSQQVNAQPISGNGGVTDPGDPATPGQQDNGQQDNNGQSSTQNGNAAPSSVDMTLKGTQNRQEGNTIYVVDGGLYNDTGSYNMDFYKEDGYLNSSFSCRNAAMTIVDNNALYYINSALDVNVEAVGVNYGGICYDGCGLFYVTDYSTENSALYLVDKVAEKKYKIDESVSGYTVVVSPNGRVAAYTRYTDTGMGLFVGGIGMEPQQILDSKCDVFSVSNEGMVIYGAAADDDDNSYSIYSYKSASDNKAIVNNMARRIYVNNAFDAVLIHSREDNNLYYYDSSMSDAALVYDKGATEVFMGAFALEDDYMVKVMESPTLYGAAFYDDESGVYVFNGPDKEVIYLADKRNYDLQSYVSDDACYYMCSNNKGEILKYKYTMSSGAVEEEYAYSTDGASGEFIGDTDLENIWFCTREGELYLLRDGEKKLLADGLTYAYSGAIYHNAFENRLYAIRDGKICTVDEDGNVADTGVEADGFYSSYYNELATGFIDKSSDRYLLIAGRVIKD